MTTAAASTTNIATARRLLVVLLATAALMTLLPLIAKPAQAAGYATSRGFACETQSRRVMAFPPQMTSTTGQLQMVYWSPDLYRWNGSRWALYDGSRPWYYGVANRNGVQYNSFMYGSWFTPQNNSLQFVPFAGLPRGYYKIADYYRWGSTGHYAPASFVARAAAWSHFRGAGGGQYCYMP